MIEDFKRYMLYKEHKSSNTIKNYSRFIQEFINWYSSNRDEECLRLDIETINSYKNHLIFEEKKKMQDVNIKLCALAAFSRFFYYKSAPKNYISHKKHRTINLNYI